MKERLKHLYPGLFTKTGVTTLNLGVPAEAIADP